MNRRNFIQLSSVAAAATLLPISCISTDASKKYKLGYQLYSIRDLMDVDPVNTLKSLKAMGYQDFETYGLDTSNLGYYGYKASDFKNILDDLELSVSSGHYGFSDYLEKTDDELLRYVDFCIEGAKALGARYITWPWMDHKYRNMEGFYLLTKKLNRIGERVTNAGLGFAYHNHGYEFEDHNGTHGFEAILKETDPELVKFQMDMYWVMHENRSTPKEMVAAQPGRYVMWHIKDMHRVSRDYTELGNGSIDYPTLLPDPKTSGLEYYYIEQGGNFSVNSEESARTSAKYFKAELQRYL